MDAAHQQHAEVVRAVGRYVFLDYQGALFDAEATAEPELLRDAILDTDAA
jgi:hypothetical protein